MLHLSRVSGEEKPPDQVIISAFIGGTVIDVIEITHAS